MNNNIIHLIYTESQHGQTFYKAATGRIDILKIVIYFLYYHYGIFLKFALKEEIWFCENISNKYEVHSNLNYCGLVIIIFS